ncbi:MAG: hypothetical protein C4291_15835 [Candidatus Dadabacteria bacterium]
MSKLQLGMSKEEFYKVMAIALAFSLVMSWALFYGYYVSVQPYIKPSEPFRAMRVEGIVSVYKNGKLVHEGPDVLTNSFYQYLPFLLGNVCAYSGAPLDTCPNNGFANTLFLAPPPTPSCQVSISGTTITSVAAKAPNAGTTTTPIYIGVGSSNTANPGDCVLSAVGLAGATTSVYSPFTGNFRNPPAPCPNPTEGCVQISATISFSSSATISDTMLYAVVLPAGPYYTLIAHDVINPINVVSGDTLTVLYTFIFPGIATNAGAYSGMAQGAIAALFAQCLARQNFGIGTSTTRLCIDNTLPTGAVIGVYPPASPCSDQQVGTQGVGNGANKITIAFSPTQKYAQVYAPMGGGGNGIQLVMYSLGISGWGSTSILIASQSCSLATSGNFQFVAGQAVGIQLNFP